MQTLSLPIHGGGVLEVHGRLDARRMVVIVSRENIRLDDGLMERLIVHLTGRGLTVARYLSQAAETARLIDPPRIERWPLRLRQLWKSIRLLRHPRLWRHYLASHRRMINSIDYRCESLRALIRWLGPDREILVLARSAGARVASLVADEMNVSRLLCLGYPFQHPEEGPDPARFAHLPAVRTPCLILQGDHDIYGGAEIAGRYALGPNMRLEFVPATHNFGLDEATWPQVLARIDAFLAGAAPEAAAVTALAPTAAVAGG